MNIRFILSLVSVSLLATAVSCEKNSPEADFRQESGPMIINESPAAVNGELIIKLKPSSGHTKAAGSASRPEDSLSEVSGVLSQNGRFTLERLFPENPKFRERAEAEGLDKWFIATFDKSVKSSDVVRQLKACATIEAIEYCLPMVASDAEYTPVSPMSAGGRPRVSRKDVFPFNEGADAVNRQWHYNNTGAVLGKSSLTGADANVWPAWKKTAGDRDVIVAVIDQGVMFGHEDLAANMWVNEKEIDGNGIDDDNNGYVDDIYGYNFINDKGLITATASTSHGTHVAGTIAAVNNNGKGVNGIAGGTGNGDGVRIMSLQTLGLSESGSSGSGLGGAVRAMVYAADNGAVICQNSWGYPQQVSWNTWTRSSYSALRRAMDYFIKYAGVDKDGNQSGPMKGGIIIFAAGNEAVNYMSFPAADSKVVSVASYGYNGNAAPYTNYGSWVSLAAPGGNTYIDGENGGVYSTVVNEDGTSGYGYMQGTSMACPHVSGACALAVSYWYGKEKKQGLTPDMLRSALLSSAAPINDNIATAYKGQMGAGMLDTAKLLEYMDFLGDIPSQTIKVGGTLELKISEWFPSTRVVSYSVSDRKVAGVSLENGVLTVEGIAPGTATITLSDGRYLYKSFEIKVGR